MKSDALEQYVNLLIFCCVLGVTFYHCFWCASETHQHSKRTLQDFQHRMEFTSIDQPTAGSFHDGHMDGKHFHFTTLDGPPAVIKTGNGSDVRFQGLCFEIISALKSVYNFTFTVEEPPDRTYGSSINGSWGGMIGMVVRNECDLALGSFSITHGRYQAVDFSVGFYEETKTILIPPPTTESRLFECIRPFHWQVWIGILISMSIISLALWQFTEKYKRQWSNSKMKKTSFTHSYIFVLGVLLSQSGLANRLTRNNPTAVLSSTWCLIAVVLIYAYIGTFISFLTLPKLKPIISSLEDLPSSRLTWVVDQGTSLDSIFLNAKEGIYKAIGDGLRRHPEFFVPFENGVGPPQVLKGTSAYISDKSVQEYIMSQDFKRTGQCRLSLAKMEFQRVFKGLIFPKQSSLKPFIDKKLLQMVEGGLIDYWRQKISSKSSKQCDSINGKQKINPHSLSLNDMQSLFLIWGIGIVLSLTTFAIEIVAAVNFSGIRR